LSTGRFAKRSEALPRRRALCWGGRVGSHRLRSTDELLPARRLALVRHVDRTKGARTPLALLHFARNLAELRRSAMVRVPGGPPTNIGVTR
jgi:hypothetical protein